MYKLPVMSHVMHGTFKRCIMHLTKRTCCVMAILYCPRFLFSTLFVDFLFKKYTYLSVKMNWNQYVAKILRFNLSLVSSLSQENFTRTKTRSYGDLYWENLMSYQSDHLALFRWPLWRKRARWSDWHHLSIRKLSGVLAQFFNIIIWVLFNVVCNANSQ